MNDDKIVAIILAATLIIGLGSFLVPGCHDEVLIKWHATITYTNGQKDTMNLFTPEGEVPRIRSNGCVYDYMEKDYICGVRRIGYREGTPDD